MMSVLRLRNIVYGMPLDEPWQSGIMAGWLVVGNIITVKILPVGIAP